MRVLLKEGLIVLIPESVGETGEVEAWRSTHASHVLCVRASDSQSLELHDLGGRDEACREPINVISNSPDPIAKMISNFATTPFDLDGQLYQSVESFWQGLSSPRTAIVGAWRNSKVLGPARKVPNKVTAIRSPMEDKRSRLGRGPIGS